MSKKLRIGGASGFWGDSVIATPQLLNGNDLDFMFMIIWQKSQCQLWQGLEQKTPQKAMQ